MARLLKEFNTAGLIDKLEGHDERFDKILAAADIIAEKLQDDPSLLIRAALAGLDPNSGPDEPTMQIAAQAMEEVWQSYRSVHVDHPTTIYRYILLDACNQLASELRAAILWNISADTLPFLRLGREEKVIHGCVSGWARNAEEFSLVVPDSENFKKAPITKRFTPPQLNINTYKKFDEEALLPDLAATVAPNFRGNSHESDLAPNPHWAHQHQQWAWEFADRMSKVLADNFDALSENAESKIKDMSAYLTEVSLNASEHYQSLLSSQRSWLQSTLEEQNRTRQSERTQLNTLWWCEALYSPSLTKSYRELPVSLATAVMPLDLLDELNLPVNASVSYALFEAVGKLSGANFCEERGIEELLEQIGSESESCRQMLRERFEQPPEHGRLCIRDLVASIIFDPGASLSALIAKSCLTEETRISLPRLAQIVFRQEQAMKLAGAGT